MEEVKKSDEAKHGDQALKDREHTEASSEPVSNESTITQPEGGKPEPDYDTLEEEKISDPISPTLATNPEEIADSSKVVIDEQLSTEKKTQSSGESLLETPPVQPKDTVEPSTCEEEAIASSSEVGETATKSSALEEVTKTNEESVTSKEIESATENMEETPTVEQAMEVEEPAVPVPIATVSIQEQIAQEQQLETAAVQKITNNSLSLLSQYSGSSDSEAEETDNSKADDTKKRAHSSSSSSSDDSSDVELVKDTAISGNYRVRDDPILVSDAETMDTNAASSEDEEDDLARGPIRTAGEILPHELPPIEELTISVPEAECKPIGHVESIVSQIVLVQSVVGAELLNLDTVLFLERGQRALGKIFDVIGQVNRPIYCVLFNSNQEVLSKNITVGMEVYCAPRTEYTSFIILSDLMRLKGSDASWMNDNEVPAYHNPHQYRPRFPPRNQQYHQQMPHMQPPPQGGLYLPNPFAGQGPPRPPSTGPN
uniref:H/ACA ribonucleoprotein complex non-core subunit NAF1 n=1 Tax=Anopheles farauti TaxID=69004 RepID=A0A182QUU2_9DIPT